MTPADMLDYTFGLLDEPRHAAFQRSLANDPELSVRVARLGSAIAQLVDDGQENEPPTDLSARTIALIEHRRQHPQLQDFAPTRVPFRWTDLAVAATVLFAGLLTLTVPLLRSRAQMDQTACAFNLRQLGVSLIKYASTHGSFPRVPDGDPVGSYGVMLRESRDLSDPGVLACPCAAKSQSKSELPDDYERYRKIIRQSPQACRDLIGRNFAYNLGYRHSGETVPVSGTPPDVIPIASDGPKFDEDGRVYEGNSPNHGGRGQNVLFSDGHVTWKRDRWISAADKDLFLNEDHLPEPGLHPTDSALGPCLMRVSTR